MGCVYKTRTKHASKDGIELAVLKALREVLIEVLSFEFGVAELVLVHLLVVLLVDGFSVVHTVIYDAHKLESEIIMIWIQEYYFWAVF